MTSTYMKLKLNFLTSGSVYSPIKICNFHMKHFQCLVYVLKHNVKITDAVADNGYIICGVCFVYC